MRMIARAVFAALILGLLPPSFALAADYGGRYGYPPPPVEIGSGWYLRGNVGFEFMFPPGMSFEGTALGSTSGGSAFVVGGGLGYEFSDRFRSDVTVDYWSAATASGTLDCNTGQVCTNSMGISAIAGLVNAYWDLATIGGFTPYVGAGVGVAMVTTSGNRSVDDDAPPTTATYGGATRYNLAWALMAGASMAVTPEVALDVDFRLTSLGNARTGVVPTAAGGDDTNTIGVGNILAPEIRVGMRYKID